MNAGIWLFVYHYGLFPDRGHVSKNESKKIGESQRLSPIFYPVTFEKNLLKAVRTPLPELRLPVPADGCTAIQTD